MEKNKRRYRYVLFLFGIVLMIGGCRIVEEEPEERKKQSTVLSTLTPAPTQKSEESDANNPGTTQPVLVTPTVTDNGENKATPKAAATPKPTATPRPTATPKPTVTPRPTATPKPTTTPKPTATPTPTAGGTPEERILSDRTLSNVTLDIASVKIINAKAGQNDYEEVRKNLLHNMLDKDGGYRASGFRVTREQAMALTEEFARIPGVTMLRVREENRYINCSDYSLEMELDGAIRYLYAYATGDMTHLNSAEKQAYDKIKKVVGEAEKNCDSDYEKELYFHDYLVKNVSYGGSHPFEEGQTPVGAMVEGECVCAGYSASMQMMLTMSGIPNRVIFGQAEGGNHAWNLIQLDGKWYHVDVTFDDPSPDRGDKIGRYYINLTDEEIQKTHIWPHEDYPKCTATKYFYFNQSGNAFDNSDAAVDFCLSRSENNENEVVFYIRGEQLDVKKLANVLHRSLSYSAIPTQGGTVYEVFWK